MAINVSTNFKVNTNLPIDERFVVENVDALYDMKNAYTGLQVYVKSEEKFWVCTNFDSSAGAIGWEEVKAGGSTHYEGTIGVDGDSVDAIFTKFIPEDGYVVGDTFVIRELITDGKYSYTAYVYNGTNWAAMDGNYNAENVYFAEDLTVTNAIGTITQTMITSGNGSTVLSAKGKSIKQVLSTLLAEPKSPTATLPSASIVLTSANANGANHTVEIGTSVTPSYKTTFSAGSYTYGPATGVTSTAATVKLNSNPTNYTDTNNINANSLNGATGSLDSYIVTDTTQRKLTLSYGWTAGTTTPLNNLGEEYIDTTKNLPIQAATNKTVTSSHYIQGYRNSFYGVYSSKGDNGTTSDTIRTLTKSGKTLANGNTFTISIKADTQRVVIAYPATLRDLTKVLDANDSNSNIVSGFGTPQIIKVESANGYDSIDYKVYTMDFAGAYGTTNTFTVTI